ncbi:MAG: hypothetical protein IV100_08550 [Myxococcales bacterium]|nr:hypothetical protein [Myxococcales bacterium]
MANVIGRVCIVAVALAACVPERRPRRDAGAPPWDNCGTDSSHCDDPFDDPSVVENSVIELEDDPNNSTLSPCDTGPMKSPGADIDAAELNGGTFLSSCQLTMTSPCENDNASGSSAEGSPDATGAEETGTYTSLNGGLLRCRWSNGSVVTSSDNITVIAIRYPLDLGFEQYRIRLCDALTSDCRRSSPYASGEVSFSGADLF